MPKPDKKQRQKARRQAKKQEIRRRDSISPIKRLADAPGEIECWMSNDLEKFEQAAALCWKRAGGLAGVACFLVDRGVVGLKDAWTRVGLEKADFEGIRERYESGGLSLQRVEVDAVRKLVAGAARWAHDNGMRLPKDWIKTASIIGGVGDWAHADLTGFVKEFAGHPQDLRNRLLTEPFETYIQRTDVDFIFSNNAPYEGDGESDEENESLDDMEDREELALEELEKLLPKLTPPASKMAEETAKWLHARSEQPSPELLEAWQMMLLAIALAGIAMPGGPPAQVARFSITLLKGLKSRVDDERLDDYEQALRQVHDHSAADTEMIHRVMQNCFKIDADKS